MRFNSIDAICNMFGYVVCHLSLQWRALNIRCFENSKFSNVTNLNTIPYDEIPPVCVEKKEQRVWNLLAYVCNTCLSLWNSWSTSNSFDLLTLEFPGNWKFSYFYFFNLFLQLMQLTYILMLIYLILSIEIA